MLDSLWNLENDRFLWNRPFDFCKISWGLKKKQKKKTKKTFSELFFQTDMEPPPPPPPPLMTKIPGSANDEDGYGKSRLVRSTVGSRLCNIGCWYETATCPNIFIIEWMMIPKRVHCQSCIVIEGLRFRASPEALCCRHFILCLVLVQHKKTRPDMTEKMLTGA